MLKYYLFLILFAAAPSICAQSLTFNKSDDNLQHCKTINCRIKKSFLQAEYFLEKDDIIKSQEWLDNTKNLISSNAVDSTKFFINSLQSEIFYYKGLYQFGINEADKAIENARKLNDSLFIANGYFFKGINLLEANELNLAQKNLLQSKNFQPKNIQSNHIRFCIRNEHIYSNIAHIKQMMKQSDSAIWYNSRAYDFAIKGKGLRAIANIEQNYGQIYLENNQLDSAKYFLDKSMVSAKLGNYQDIILSNYGFLMQCYPDDMEQVEDLYNNSLTMIGHTKINISYKVFFYKNAIAAFKKFQQLQNLTDAQERLLKLNEQISTESNDYIQSIAKQYVKNQNRMLNQEINLIKNRNERQIFYVLIALLSLVLIGLFMLLKQRQKLKNREIKSLKQSQDISMLEAIIDGEENERRRIAQDLHDGLNGDLSAIRYRIAGLEHEELTAVDHEILNETIALIDQSCAQVRNISHNLMPASIVDFGLVETIQQYCSKISRTHNIQIDFQYFGNQSVLPKKSETVIYRIIQELINNIIKHSRATTALVQLNFHDHQLFITVEDNGIGFDIKKSRSGIGLTNIESRTRYLNANLQIDSTASGSGFHINIDLNTLKND